MIETMSIEVAKERHERLLHEAELSRLLADTGSDGPAAGVRVLIAVADFLIAGGETLKRRYQPAMP